MDKHQIKELLRKYENGTCSELEKAQLETWYLRQPIPDKLDLSASELDTELSKIWDSLEQEYQASHKEIRWKKLVIAASILFIFSVGFYYYIGDNIKKTSVKREETIAADIEPGENKAIYTDSLGKQQVLQDEVFVASTSLTNENSPCSDAGYNTIATPRGGQYEVVLADGTHVWLNAASSLKYSNAFNDVERTVELTGEAYFEVKHMPDKPFKVISQNQTVKVLGTHFNINSYKKEPDIKTTLLEGSVDVSNDRGKLILLKQGEQSVNTANMISKRKVSVEEVLAWKSGFFHFENASLETVLNQLSLWYDVEVDIKKIPRRKFNGILPRHVKLSQIFMMMEKTSGLKFKVEERRILMDN